MRLKYGIAIAGMHGKTTTTSMVASVLAAGGLDPTVVVGGRVDALGSNAKLGSSQYLVAEADESDRSFLKLSPILAVVTNLDREHMDCYRDMADVEQAFLTFIDKLPFYGAVTACIDDQLLAAILPRARRRVFTYGVAAEADYRLTFTGEGKNGPTESHGSFARFCVLTAHGALGPFELNVPGHHNVLNATAAVAIAHQLGVVRSDRPGPRPLSRRGPALSVARHGSRRDGGRRLRPSSHRDSRYLAAARECGYRRIHVVFQPHRYSRTLDLLDGVRLRLCRADTVTFFPSTPPVRSRSKESTLRHW